MNSKKSIGGLMNYLYGASLQGIQSFIFETNKLKEIIGASEMIEQLCSSQFMKKYDIPDHNFIIKAAGNIKCIIRDKAKIQNIVKTWPKFVSNRAPGLFFSQAMIEYDGELKKEYLDELERKLIVTKNKSSLTTSLSPMAAIRSRRTGKPAVDWLDSIKKNKQTPRDATSKAKQIAGAIDAPQRLMDKCFDIPEQKKTSLYPFDVTDMLLENESTGWLAVIHADGNSLGNKIQQMIRQLNKQHKDVKGHFKIFSEQLDKSTINATKYAIKQVVMPVYNKSINKEKYPGASSTCYGLTADIYHSTIKPVNDTIKSKKNTVKLYFFRPDIHFGSLRDFNIFDSDGNQILKLGNGEKLLYETHTSGELKFYAGKNGKNLFKIEVISGQEYYIVCRLVEGWVNTKFEMTQSEQ